MNNLEIELERSISRVHFLLVLRTLEIIDQGQFNKLYKELRHVRRH